MMKTVDIVIGKSFYLYRLPTCISLTYFGISSDAKHDGYVSDALWQM